MQPWYVHDLSPIAFEVFGVPVRWYGLSYAAGFLIGDRILALRARLDGRYPPNFGSGDFVLYVIAGVLIGGRLGEVLFYNARWFLEHPLHILFLWEGGMSSHGGMLGLVAATWLFAARHGPAALVLLDDVVLAATPGLFLGRVANFINAEMIGKITDVPWAVVFPRADMAPRHPVQLYQALCEGPILAGILRYAMRSSARPARQSLSGVVRGVAARHGGVPRSGRGLSGPLARIDEWPVAVVRHDPRRRVDFWSLAAVSRCGVMSAPAASVTPPPRVTAPARRG